MTVQGLIKGKNLLKGIETSSIYKNYKKSINVRRKGSALSHNAFGRYAKRAYAYFYNKSVILGQFNENVFCVSHYCPNTKREGVKLLKEMTKSDTPIAFAITSDLVNMLTKLGFIDSGESKQMYFRGHYVEKRILLNVIAFKQYNKRKETS